MIDNKVMTLQVCNVCKLHHHQSRISSHTCVYLGNTPLTLAIKYSNKTKKKKNWVNSYLQWSSISGTDLVLFSSKQTEPSSSLSENTDSWGWCDDTRNVVHSWRINTGFEQFAGDEALVRDGWPTRRLAVSSWLLILPTSILTRLQPFEQKNQRQGVLIIIDPAHFCC